MFFILMEIRGKKELVSNSPRGKHLRIYSARIAKEFNPTFNVDVIASELTNINVGNVEVALEDKVSPFPEINNIKVGKIIDAHIFISFSEAFLH